MLLVILDLAVRRIIKADRTIADSEKCYIASIVVVIRICRMPNPPPELPAFRRIKPNPTVRREVDRGDMTDDLL